MINKLADIYVKLAQVNEDFLPIKPEEVISAKNHLQQIAQKATTVYQYVSNLVGKGQMHVTALEKAQDIRNIVNHVYGLAQVEKPDWNAIERDILHLTGPRELSNRVNSAENERYPFLSLKENYFTAEWIQRFNYKPMIEIQKSLEYLQNFLDKKRRV